MLSFLQITLLAWHSILAQMSLPFPGPARASAGGGGGGGISLVSGQVSLNYNSGSSPWTATLPNPPASGNYIFIAVEVINFGFGNNVTGITCTNTSGWAQISGASIFNGTDGDSNIQLWRGLAGASASAACTINADSNTASITGIMEFTGLTGAADATTPATNTGAGTALSLGSFTNTTAASLLFAGAAIDQGNSFTASPSSPWISLGSQAGGNNALSLFYRVTSTSAAQTAAWTANFSVNWATLIAGQY